MNSGSYEENIERVFDSYCKRVIKRKFLDYHREIKRRSKREIIFSDMSAQALENLAVTDAYFADECNPCRGGIPVGYVCSRPFIAFYKGDYKMNNNIVYQIDTKQISMKNTRER